MKYDLYYGKPTSYSFAEIVDQFSSKSINSIKTSTIPFLEYWKSTEQRLQLLKKNLNIKSNVLKLCFEYPTPSYKSNKSSMTDLMIIGEKEKIAVEAKYTEVKVKLEMIDKWKLDSKGQYTENRKEVLNHWIKMIKPFLLSQLKVEEIGTLPYQFLHRTASACYENNGTAYVIYQLFYDDETKSKMEKYVSKITDAVKLIQPSEKLKFYIGRIKVRLKDRNIEKESILQELKIRSVYDIQSEVELEKL